MKRMLFVFLIGSLCAALHAADFVPFAATSPAATMQSVNKTGMMNSGSTYAPVVYEVGASNPSPAMGPRKVAPGTDDSGHDPSNPNFGPIGDALIPLLLMVMAYATYLLLRRRKSRV